MNQDNVRNYIETEHRCEIQHLAITKLAGTFQNHQSFKVDGIAYRNGERLLVGGLVNEHNFSGVKVWDSSDNPFLNL